MKKNASLPRTLCATALLVCLLPVAHAQWSWKDKDGSRVFSDQPPPPGVAEKDILKRPPGVRAPTSAATTDSPTASPSDPKANVAANAGAAPKISGKDAELEKKRPRRGPMMKKTPPLKKKTANAPNAQKPLLIQVNASPRSMLKASGKSWMRRHAPLRQSACKTLLPAIANKA
jgi:Domain of unknown function (DUF4124)